VYWLIGFVAAALSEALLLSYRTEWLARFAFLPLGAVRTIPFPAARELRWPADQRNPDGTIRFVPDATMVVVRAYPRYRITSGVGRIDVRRVADGVELSAYHMPAPFTALVLVAIGAATLLTAPSWEELVIVAAIVALQIVLSRRAVRRQAERAADALEASLADA
jgi:hypothetical protein